MKKIESIIRPEKLDDVKKALSLVGVKGMTVTEVEGIGKQPAEALVYRGQPFTVDLLPKVKVEVVVTDEMKEQVIAEIIKTARTGEVGDGKIFVSTINEVYRIRTSETDKEAI